VATLDDDLTPEANALEMEGAIHCAPTGNASVGVQFIAPASNLPTSVPAPSLHASGQQLPRAFFARSALEVAPDLLGLWLVHDRPEGRQDGRIVEVEAYVGVEDLACHASKGRTARTSVMFGPAGHAYVYLIYGMHHCFNVVTDLEGVGAAVLVRALEPGAGVSGRTDGPGRLCRTLGIDRGQNALDLTADGAGGLWIERRPGAPVGEIATSPRIGVDYAGEWAARPWRFFLPGSRHLSVRPRRT
jgi:DNA-3-methyladenine glycosylase